VAQIHGFWIEALLTREGQQTVDQRASPFGGLHSTPQQWQAAGIVAYRRGPNRASLVLERATLGLWQSRDRSVRS
jgi:hypothetical protein